MTHAMLTRSEMLWIIKEVATGMVVFAFTLTLLLIVGAV